MAKRIYNDITETIGRTPLVRLNRVFAGSGATVLAKLEKFNPCGSVKARPALEMITAAEAAGKLVPGATIIEPTSGNTGIALAMVCAARGYKCVLVMPESMSVERRKILRAYGAQIELSPAVDGMSGAVRWAEKLLAEQPDAFMPQQFDNPDNPRAHEKTTGPEIWDDCDGELDCLVAGIGTGGTISGVAGYLKGKNPAIKIVGVEPAESPVISQTISGEAVTPAPHPHQGIGAGFIPGALDMELLDEVVTINRSEAFDYCRKLAQLEGIFAGVSAGTAVAAVAKMLENNLYDGKTIVVVIPDGGEKYLSTALYE